MASPGPGPLDVFPARSREAVQRAVDAAVDAALRHVGSRVNAATAPQLASTLALSLPPPSPAVRGDVSLSDAQAAVRSYLRLRLNAALGGSEQGGGGSSSAPQSPNARAAAVAAAQPSRVFYAQPAVLGSGGSAHASPRVAARPAYTEPPAAGSPRLAPSPDAALLATRQAPSPLPDVLGEREDPRPAEPARPASSLCVLTPRTARSKTPVPGDKTPGPELPRPTPPARGMVPPQALRGGEAVTQVAVQAPVATPALYQQQQPLSGGMQPRQGSAPPPPLRPGSIEAIQRGVGLSEQPPVPLSAAVAAVLPPTRGRATSPVPADMVAARYGAPSADMPTGFYRSSSPLPGRPQSPAMQSAAMALARAAAAQEELQRAMSALSPGEECAGQHGQSALASLNRAAPSSDVAARSALTGVEQLLRVTMVKGAPVPAAPVMQAAPAPAPALAPVLPVVRTQQVQQQPPAVAPVQVDDVATQALPPPQMAPAQQPEATPADPKSPAEKQAASMRDAARRLSQMEARQKRLLVEVSGGEVHVEEQFDLKRHEPECDPDEPSPPAVKAGNAAPAAVKGSDGWFSSLFSSNGSNSRGCMAGVMAVTSQGCITAACETEDRDTAPYYASRAVPAVKDTALGGAAAKSSNAAEMKRAVLAFAEAHVGDDERHPAVGLSPAEAKSAPMPPAVQPAMPRPMPVAEPQQVASPAGPPARSPASAAAAALARARASAALASTANVATPAAPRTGSAAPSRSPAPSGPLMPEVAAEVSVFMRAVKEASSRSNSPLPQRAVSPMPYTMPRPGSITPTPRAPHMALPLPVLKPRSPTPPPPAARAATPPPAAVLAALEDDVAAMMARLNASVNASHAARRSAFRTRDNA
jgi:hypothetical protein